MARDITLLKDITSPNQKQWTAGGNYIVSDEIAAYLVGEGTAKYTDQQALEKAINEVSKKKYAPSKKKVIRK